MSEKIKTAVMEVIKAHMDGEDKNTKAVLSDVMESVNEILEQQPCDECRNKRTSICGNCKEYDEYEPCDDAISREYLKKIAQSEGAYGYVSAHDIATAPSVTQKSGVWVEIDDEPHEVWECDHCGFVIDGSGCIEPYEYRDTYKYCPNCGACMKDGRTLDEFIEDSKESEDKE